MGERMSGGAVPGRRHVHPGGAVSDPEDVREAAALETMLAAALCAGDLDPEAEQRAVAAFRATHGTAAHRARTRRRDDWRPAAERRAGRSVKVTFGVVFASLTLGGVAVAAIGSTGSSADGAGAGRGTAHPSAVAPDRPGREASSVSPSGRHRPADGSGPGQDTAAHCRAYEQVGEHGKALDARAWQRLVAAAGGKDKVTAYCSEQPARATATPSRPAGRGEPGAGAADAGNGAAGKSDASGNGTSGNTPGSTGSTGNAGGDKGSGKHK
ncbi:hypothetical protein [Streptomyces sp. NPDC017958]|uniref:hypothetical protein n=1 Tax=Streptomyces sp. NPDC017958 TaxID=3365021 RepID=UPI0037A99E5D